MRVVAGELRGRRVIAPDGTTTRPTTDKVREAIFNALGSLDVLADSVVVDLYAGSGALGIEALSRGAARCTFVERSRPALAAITTNVRSLGVAERTRVVNADALSAAAGLPADVAFADPPYDFAKWPQLLSQLDAGLVVAESGIELEADAVGDGRRGPWEVVRARRYGRTWVTFLQPLTAAD